MTLNCFTDDWEVVTYARKGPLVKDISLLVVLFLLSSVVLPVVPSPASTLG